MDVVIRPLTGDEWTLWKDTRLRALADAPHAFCSTLAEEERQPDEDWRAMVERTAAYTDADVFMAFAEGRPAGMMFARVDDEAVLHIGAMWVDPDARRKGVGAALLGRAFAFGAERGAATASLAVTINNGSAETLYEAAGFEPTGQIEPLREGSEFLISWMRRAL